MELIRPICRPRPPNPDHQKRLIRMFFFCRTKCWTSEMIQCCSLYFITREGSKHLRVDLEKKSKPTMLLILPNLGSETFVLWILFPRSSKGCKFIKSGYKAPTNNIGSEILVASPKVIPKVRGQAKSGHETMYEHTRGEIDVYHRPEDSNGPYSELQSQLPTAKVMMEIL